MLLNGVRVVAIDPKDRVTADPISLLIRHGQEDLERDRRLERTASTRPHEDVAPPSAFIFQDGAQVWP